MQKVIIIGAGLAGMSASVTLAEHGISCALISLQNSERAQSVLAEGGINAALNTMGEDDTVQNHYEDTLRGGVYLADPNAVQNLTSHAPEIVRWLENLGVPFNMTDSDIMLRNFGGQKKKRTAYARSSTGKIIMTALIDAVRKHEASGLVKRYPHHDFIELLTENQVCRGVRVQDAYTGKITDFKGIVLLCSGGMNGIFPSMTTGTTQNSGDVTATVFRQGVKLGNPEMIQYHPTTVGISGKRCLVTEAARGEGGRLCILRNNQKYYFMEEKYPELGNLMPRDVVAREMYFIRRESGGEVYLDMTELSSETWQKKLSDLRQEIMHYLA
ncbi:MAG: FAD-binding protein, partial [Oscillospiraceae bacterium]|nr:FAD-binding protein [Oscillospiraceae bacterium]